MYFSRPPAQFVDYNTSNIFACENNFMFVSLFPFPPHKIHTTYFKIYPSVTSFEMKQVYSHAAFSLPLITPGTHGFIYLLGNRANTCD